MERSKTNRSTRERTEPEARARRNGSICGGYTRAQNISNKAAAMIATVESAQPALTLPITFT